MTLKVAVGEGIYLFGQIGRWAWRVRGVIKGFTDVILFNRNLFNFLFHTRRVSRDSMDLLFPPVRAGCCVALQLVAFFCFMSNDLLAILAIFVLRVGLAVAMSAVAAFFAAVTAYIVPSPCG